jgi:hypothetical protein
LGVGHRESRRLTRPFVRVRRTIEMWTERGKLEYDGQERPLTPKLLI